MEGEREIHSNCIQCVCVCVFRCPREHLSLFALLILPVRDYQLAWHTQGMCASEREREKETWKRRMKRNEHKRHHFKNREELLAFIALLI